MRAHYDGEKRDTMAYHDTHTRCCPSCTRVSDLEKISLTLASTSHGARTALVADAEDVGQDEQRLAVVAQAQINKVSS